MDGSAFSVDTPACFVQANGMREDRTSTAREQHKRTHQVRT
jgi:hypothetical protein